MGGAVEKLSTEQSQQLEEHLRRHIYLYVKDIVAYVQSMWLVVYTSNLKNRTKPTRLQIVKSTTELRTG